MTRDEALALLERMRCDLDEVPELDGAALAEWYVAIRDKTGLRKELKLLDQQIGRTDRRIAKLLRIGVAKG